jgi:hypothetical protein
MSIDYERLRELAAGEESTKLEFKSAAYDSDRRGSAELAKDIMAMANAISSSGTPSHILVGLDEALPFPARLVGVPPAAHLDDADYHQKLASRLNRMPEFSYHRIDDTHGLSFGVFEVCPGRRPYYAISDSPPLQRNVAFYRDGTTTLVASPDKVLEWHAEDDPDRAELHRLQLEKAREELAIRPLVRPAGKTNSGVQLGRSFHIENLGHAPFRITSATFEARFTESCDPYLRKQGIASHGSLEPIRGEMSIGFHGVVRSERSYRLDFTLTAEQVAQHVSNQCGVDVEPGVHSSWFDIQVEVRCEGAGGRSEVVRLEA